MSTVFAPVGPNQTGSDHHLRFGNNARDLDVAAALPNRSGEIAGPDAMTHPGSEAWVERLLFGLGVALAVVAWALVAGPVIR